MNKAGEGEKREEGIMPKARFNLGLIQGGLLLTRVSQTSCQKIIDLRLINNEIERDRMR